jgi:large subunit ribosomal protein L14
MVQKTSILTPVDKSGALNVNVFQIYGGGKKKTGYVGDFIKVSVRSLTSNPKVKKKNKFISILVRSRFSYSKLDGSVFLSDSNSCVLLKKRLTPVGKELYGPVYRSVKRRKFISSFSGSI